VSLGLRDSRDRRRRKFRLAVFKWVLALTLIVLAGVFAYETGSRLAERETIRLKEQIAELSQTIEESRRDDSELKVAAEAAEQGQRDWQQRYERDVPTGVDKQLYELARQKLADGVDLERLKFVIQATQNERQCAEGLATRRFIVPTPLYKGANDSVGFAKGTITVTAKGQSSRDSAGNPLARFDPAKEVTLLFTQLGGQVTEARGILPLHHSVIVGDSEYRFSVVAGTPGFVLVTGDRCAYP
jgi:hypothetical protein